MTHTPTPWETRELSNGDWAISQKGAPTAHTTVHTWNGKEESATAQFIVQACNAHEGLMNLATHIVAMADDAYLIGHPEWGAIVEEAQALLAQQQKGGT